MINLSINLRYSKKYDPKNKTLSAKYDKKNEVKADPNGGLWDNQICTILLLVQRMNDKKGTGEDNMVI